MEYPGPNPDDHDVHQRLICVEYPGLVKDPTAMLKTMGGLRNISSVFSATNKERLEINFRPDNIYSKPAAATKHSTTGILLKIRVRKAKPGVSSQSVDKVQIVGTVEKMYRFENLCDFQYLPIKKVGGWTRYIYDEIMPQGIIQASWLENGTDAQLFLPPQIFSRVDSVHKHLFKKDSVYNTQDPTTLSMIGVNRQRRINHARYVEFSLHANVPVSAKALTYEILKIKLVKKEQFDMVKRLFEERPVWTRLALRNACKLKTMVLKLILPAISYYYTTGPWRVCWVRLGYDPRQHFEARYYQTLDYRVRSGALKHDTRPKYENFNAAEDPIYASIFDANTIPNYRTTFYQYCDIHLPKVQEMLDRLEAPGPICNERRGWLPFGFDEQCRDILTEIVLENYKNVFKRNLADEQDYGDDADDGTYEQLEDEFEEPELDDTELDMDIDAEC